MPKEQPLPCPFCGEAPEVTPWHGGAKTKRLVACTNDICWPNPSVVGPTRAKAVERWNMRPADYAEAEAN